MNVKHLTPELKEYILKHYDGTSVTINHMQEKSNVPRNTITAYATRFRLCKKTPIRWSEIELEYLKHEWGRKTESAIAKNLGRTQMAVHLKARRLELGGRKINYSCREVGNLLGICSKSVKSWGDKGLKITKAKTDAKIWSIKFEDLEEFLEKNPDCWDSRKMKYSLWVNDPQWLKVKKLEDKTKPKNRFKKWNSLQDKKLLELFIKGIDFKVIAESLNRSEEAIRHRLGLINYGREGK